MVCTSEQTAEKGFLSKQLELCQIEVYYPRIRIKPVNRRARKIKPYSPGYVFGHVDLEQVSVSILPWMPEAVGLVFFGGVPAHVPDCLITAIRQRVDEINAAGGEWLKGLKQGDLVTIQDGPFKGYEAIFDVRLSGDERVRVLLKVLNRQQFPLELPGSHIQRKSNH